jgi:HEAT repeat protein
MPDVAADKRKAARLLDAASIDSARALVSALAQRCPNDTGVLALQVRLYSAERRLLDATAALRRRDSLAGQHDSALAVTVLQSALKDEDEQVVVCTIGACGELALAPMFESVRSALNDRSPYIRCAAVYALPRFSRDSTVLLLAPVMLDDHPAVRAEMLKSAVRLGDTSMLQLTRAMGYLETNDYVIWNYIVMCAVLGRSAMADRVRRELSGDHDVLCTEAAAALVRTGEKRRISTVAAGLRSTEASARSAAASALGDLHATEYLDLLASCARDSDPGVREEVAYGLGEMGEEQGAGTVRTMLTDRKETVRVRALIALARLRQPDVEKIATAALADSSRSFRATAVAVLLASGAATHQRRPPRDQAVP